MDSFQIVGHRGCLVAEPENTVRSFDRAVEVGVDVLELDVRLSRDGELVVMHDATVDRTTDGHGAVADLDWSQLSALDAGKGERVPRLGEVLTAFPTIDFQVEIKDPAAIDQVLELLRSCADRTGVVTITSFRAAPVAAALAPTDRTWRAGLICGPKEAAKLDTAVELGVDHLFVHWDVADEPQVAQFAERHKPVDVWPAEDPATVRRAIDRGFAGTTSDDPEMAVRARQDHLERLAQPTASPIA